MKDKTALLAFSYYSLGLEEERVGESERAAGCYKRSLELLNDCDAGFQIVRKELTECLKRLNSPKDMQKTQAVFHGSSSKHDTEATEERKEKRIKKKNQEK